MDDINASMGGYISHILFHEVSHGIPSDFPWDLLTIYYYAFYWAADVTPSPLGTSQTYHLGGEVPHGIVSVPHIYPIRMSHGITHDPVGSGGTNILQSRGNSHGMLLGNCPLSVPWVIPRGPMGRSIGLPVGNGY